MCHRSGFRIFLLIVLLNAVPAGGVAPFPDVTVRPAPVVAAPRTERYVIVSADSQVIYRVGETLFNENNRFNLAVGITQVVRGEIVVDRANPPTSRIGTISVDISQFRSDSSRRDQAIRQRWLESARYPIAEFTPTAIRGLPAAHVEGREVNVEITGNLKVREAVRRTTFAATLKLEGDTLTGTATTQVLMTDFGFDPPAIFGILRAENEVRLEFRFTARRAP